MQIEEIMRHLPHRYPMLLVDRIIELEVGQRCVGLKNVTINEPFFQGHYPGKPIMPGVLIIEALAQAGAIVIMSDPENEGLVPLIGTIGEVKIKRPVVPGDQLLSTCEIIWYRNRMGKMRGVASVDGDEVLTTEITFKLIPREV
ncbi:MAG TPA: 3-hydroxyacyl-ACP dehydratase FabZ [Fimbriimonadaceae bacterium]|nr:3-hydroxyacyl-ACP dehydratase FabZ [Fimbriimonadaceae bacterium]